MPDLQQLLQLSQQMQGKLQQLEHDLLTSTQGPQVGGGLVRVSVDGRVVARLVAVPTSPAMFATPHAQISGTLYLVRCKSTGTVTQGPNDARAYVSSIPKTPGAHTSPAAQCL